MAKEPKDREEAKRPEPPGGDPNAAKRKDAPRGKGDDKAGFLPDDSFLLDMGEAAPRVRATGQDDANEEWLLVDDDLVASASEGDAAPSALRSTAKLPADDGQRDAEAARLVSEMKDMAAEIGPARAAPPSMVEPPADVASRIAEVEAQAVAPMDAPSASEPDFAEESGAAPEAAPAAEAAAQQEEAPVAPLQQAKAKKKGPQSTRRLLARAAGLLFVASLVGGGWYAWKNYGPFNLQKFWPFGKGESTEVAAQPIAPKTDPNAAKPAPKPAPKADPNAAKPAPKSDPVAAKPDVAPKSDPSSSIPVIQANPIAPTPAPVGDPKVQPPQPVKDPVAKAPEKPANPTTVIVDPRQPIRPAKVMPGPATAKSTGSTKKTDTIVELKNGYTMRGRLKRVKDDQLTLGVTNGEFTFPLADVKVLDGSAPEYLAPADMPPISIVLKGGQRLRGKKLKEDAERVVLVVDQGQIVVNRSEIREVSATGRIHF